MKGKLTFVEFTESPWAALYLDGQIVLEGGSISPMDVFKAIGLDIEHRVIRGVCDGMPTKLEDLKENA